MTTRPILLVRPDGNSKDAEALAAAGWPTIVDPYLTTAPTPDSAPARRLLDHIEALTPSSPTTWLVLTSPRTVRHWSRHVGSRHLDVALARAVDNGLRIAVAGEATADSLPPRVPAELVAHAPGAEALLQDLLRTGPAHALIPGSTISRPTLRAGLGGAGWTVDDVGVYQTAVVDRRPHSADLLDAGEIHAVVLRSPSAARAVASFASAPVVALAVGPTTTAACTELGWTVVPVAGGTGRDVAAALVASVGEAPAVTS